MIFPYFEETIAFDEIQNIPNWERFIRRLIDTERIAVYVTGSSAKLLSAEIATGLRGRSLDQEVFPFSFEEYLSAHSVSVNRSRVGERTRLKLNQHAERYCRQGGLPEIQQRSPNQAKEIAQISEDNGAFLENLVYITLRRTSRELGYYETKQGHEIDFVHKNANTTVLIQVAWSLKNPTTREREIRALKEAAKEFKQTQSIIVTLDEEWTVEDDEIQVIPLWKFLLMRTP